MTKGFFVKITGPKHWDLLDNLTYEEANGENISDVCSLALNLTMGDFTSSSLLYGDLLVSAPEVEKVPVRYEDTSESQSNPTDKSSSVLRFQPHVRRHAKSVKAREIKKARVELATRIVPLLSSLAEDSGLAVEDLRDEYWTEEYDPVYPNKLDEYHDSQERFLEDEDWRCYLKQLQGTSGTIQSDEESVEDLTVMPEAGVTEPPATEKMKGSKFALSVMKKFGWKEGQGLGSDGSGITTPLQVKPIKGPHKAKGRIVKLGPQQIQSHSRVVRVTRDHRDYRDDVDELGKLYSDKFGRVEKIRVEPEAFYIKFTDEISSLRLMNEVDEDQYLDETDFDRGLIKP